MKEINVNLPQYPLTVDTLGDMQEDYKSVATAIATMKNSRGQRRDFILSGCEEIGKSGYVVYDGVLYNVIANNNATANTMEIVITEKTDIVEGQTEVISTDKHIEWVEGGSIIYEDLYQASINVYRRDSEFEPLTIAGLTPEMSNTPIMCGLRGGDLVISGSYTVRGYTGAISLYLPHIYIPTVDVIIPVKVNGEYTMSVVDASTGSITVLLPSNEGGVAGVVINIIAAIDGRYII